MSKLKTMVAGCTVAITIAIVVPAKAENVLRWASAGGAATFDPDSLDSAADSRHHGQVYPAFLTASGWFRRVRGKEPGGVARLNRPRKQTVFRRSTES